MFSMFHYVLLGFASICSASGSPPCFAMCFLCFAMLFFMFCYVFPCFVILSVSFAMLLLSFCYVLPCFCQNVRG